MTAVRTIPGLVFDVYFEGEAGMKSAIIYAYSVADMMRQMRERFPSDVGADGFYDHPITGDECALDW
jgi:hypothetical protein